MQFGRGVAKEMDVIRPVRPLFWVPAAWLLAVGLALAVGESMGWPFLAAPVQHVFQQKTGRTLRWGADTGRGPARVALHFWGGIHFQSPMLQVGAPDWSQAPYLLSAQEVDVRLRYGDVWRAWQGQQLVVQSLAARQLTAYLERTADGRASWQLTPGGVAPTAPHVQNLNVQAGTLHYTDAPLTLSLDADLTLSTPASDAATWPNPTAESQRQSRVLRGRAQGHYRHDAFQLSLRSTGALPWEVAAGQGVPVAVTLTATSGLTHLDFEGTARDLMHLNGLDGAYRVRGPSLAAAGKPLGVTLPTTAAFDANGQLHHNGKHWYTVLSTVHVGQSQISGAFEFDTGLAPPRLTGVLNGKFLKLADLAPAVGVPTAPSAPHPSNKVLPTRPFDLAALRAMDADVHIALDQVDMHSQLLEPLRPFHARLQLQAGVLTLSDINTRTAQGHLGGSLSLNGQQNRAHWVAALNWDGVQLQRWVHQQRAAGQPPFVTGQLQGYAKVQGVGRSTAEILATLQGDMGANVVHGTLSHLLVEMGGLDVAESLGVYLVGDNPLVLDCALADLQVNAGTLRPRLWVLDTVDSTVWMDGSVSLARETLDLRAVVAPKDFSVLSLRSPLHIRGTFAHPTVTVEKGPVGMKLGSALLLGLINPLTAILPLLDLGDPQEARASAARCQARLHQKLSRAMPTRPRARAHAP